MKLILTILILLSPTLHGAPLTFEGEGSAYFPLKNRRYYCREVFIRFELMPNKLRFLDGGYSCYPLEASYDSSEFDIRDGKLYAEGKEVGDINDKEMNLYHYDESDDSHFHLNWKFLNDQVEYLETWDTSNGRMLEIKSLMKARP